MKPKGSGSLQLLFLLPHFYTMYSTQFLSQGNDSKRVGMQGPENGVLCLALKSGHPPLPTFQWALRWNHRTKIPRGGRNCTRQSGPEGGERGFGSGTVLVVQPLWRLRLLPWKKGHLSLYHLPTVLSAKKLIIQVEKATKR